MNARGLPSALEDTGIPERAKHKPGLTNKRPRYANNRLAGKRLKTSAVNPHGNVIDAIGLLGPP